MKTAGIELIGLGLLAVGIGFFINVCCSSPRGPSPHGSSASR